MFLEEEIEAVASDVEATETPVEEAVESAE